MRPVPIRVVPDDPSEKLDEMSRIDFGKIHSIYYNLKVKPFGTVHPKSIRALMTQFDNVWEKTVPASTESGSSNILQRRLSQHSHASSEVT